MNPKKQLKKSLTKTELSMLIQGLITRYKLTSNKSPEYLDGAINALLELE